MAHKVYTYENSWVAPEVPAGRDYLKARSNDPDTSREAAGAVQTNERQRQVLEALETFGAGSSHDVAGWINQMHGTNEIPSNISPRLSELWKVGMVRITGKKPGPMGRNVQVYEIVDLVDRI